MDLLDDIALRIYLRDERPYSRKKVRDAYKEAEDYIITRGTYLGIAENDIVCAPGYKNHKYDDTGTCIRCKVKFDKHKSNRERQNRQRFRIKNYLIVDK